MKCIMCNGFGKIKATPNLTDPKGYVTCPTCKGTGELDWDNK